MARDGYRVAAALAVALGGLTQLLFLAALCHRRLWRVTATAWAITRQRLRQRFRQRPRWADPAGLLDVSLHCKLPSVGHLNVHCSLPMVGLLDVVLAALTTTVAILPMAHAAECGVSHMSSGATVASSKLYSAETEAHHRAACCL